jgi:hypothetical protein
MTHYPTNSYTPESHSDTCCCNLCLGAAPVEIASAPACECCNEETTTTCDACSKPFCRKHLDADGLCILCAADPHWVAVKAAMAAGKDVRWTGKAYEILN